MARRRRVIVIDGVSTVLAGGVTYMSCLVNALARVEPAWVFDVVVSTGELPDRLDRRPNIRVRRASWAVSSATRFLYRQFALPVYASRIAADALLVQFPGLFLADRRQVMVAMNSHYVMEPPVAPSTRGRFYRRVQRFLFSLGYRRCDRTVYVSRQMAELARRFVGRDPQRMAVIYEAAAPQLHAFAAALPSYERRSIQPFLLAVGTVAAHKNYEVLVRAFAAAARTAGPALRLKIAGHYGALRAFQSGAGPKPTLVALAESLGVAERVEFLGVVSDRQLSELFRDCMSFVSTSMLEAFNLTAVEAMAFGVPLIVPNSSAYPEQCGDAAVYVDPSDPQDVARQILRIVNEPQTRLEYARRALKRGRLYSWERAAEQFVELLEGVSPRGAESRSTITSGSRRAEGETR